VMALRARQVPMVRPGLALGLLALVAATTQPSCQEAWETQLCKDAADKICAKWFDCWPVVSQNLWGDVDDCAAGMKVLCDDSEAWSDCDVDNEALSECNDGIEGSACGQLPSACHDVADCYGDND